MASCHNGRRKKEPYEIGGTMRLEEMLQRLPLWNAVAQDKIVQRFCFIRQDWHDMSPNDDFSFVDFDFEFEFKGVKYLHPYRIKPGQ